MPLSAGSSETIHYRKRGRRHGREPAVLLVHGAGGGSSHFVEVLEPLAADRLVVALDLPGHGKSAPFAPIPDDAALTQRYVEACAEFAERIGLGRFVWVGHSMGGALGLAFARRFPERLAALGLIASGARFPVSRSLLTMLDEQFATLPAVFVETSYSPVTDREKARRLANEQLQSAKPQLLADFRACRHLDLRAELEAIKLPCAVISGLDDIITPPRFARRLRDGLRYAELTEIARSGHFVHRERPEPVIDALRALFARALPLHPSPGS